MYWKRIHLANKSCALIILVSFITGVGINLRPFDSTLTWLSVNWWFDKFLRNFSFVPLVYTPIFQCVSTLFCVFYYPGCQRSSRSPATRLAFAASPLNSVVPKEKKPSGTQGSLLYTLFLLAALVESENTLCFAECDSLRGRLFTGLCFRAAGSEKALVFLFWLSSFRLFKQISAFTKLCSALSLMFLSSQATGNGVRRQVLFRRVL